MKCKSQENKWYISNSEEYSNNITLENLKCSVQIHSDYVYLCSKGNKGTCFEVINLDLVISCNI